MQYRTLGRTSVQVSSLGFGAMSLPTDGQESHIDESAAIAMMRYAFDHGVNYVDTAYVYHGGKSEVVVGKALGGYRDKVRIASKLPIWSVNSLDDCERFLTEQLQRLATGHIDFYLLHCIQKKNWEKMRSLGVLDWAEKARAAGRIGHIGFSFHDTLDVFKEVVDAYDWSFCQVQYNYVNESVQAGTEGVQYAAGKGLGVIVMEPLFGGTLANPPAPVRKVWDSAEPPCDPVDTALQWLWNKPEVSLVLSGMSTLQQVQQNVASAARSGVGSMSPQQLDLVARAQKEYERLSPIPCTHCGYCMPCPHGVDIPVNFELYNNATVFQGNSVGLCRNLYLSLPEGQRAAACIDCAICEERCPQHIVVSEMMPKVAAAFK
ncbi:MAG: aldo/keto reductase [Tepidisphaerales bacterium]